LEAEGEGISYCQTICTSHGRGKQGGGGRDVLKGKKGKERGRFLVHAKKLEKKLKFQYCVQGGEKGSIKKSSGRATIERGGRNDARVGIIRKWMGERSVALRYFSSSPLGGDCQLEGKKNNHQH